MSYIDFAFLHAILHDILSVKHRFQQSTQFTVYCASATMHNTMQTVLKRTYFTAVIDGVFRLNAHVTYRCETLSFVALE